MLVTSVPPGYRREAPRSTAKRIFVRLREDHGFDCGQTIVNDHVRERRRRTREMFVPLSHPPGHAQVDFTPCERKRFFLPVEGELVDCPPTGFNSRPTAWFKVHANEVQNARLIEHDLGWEALREVDPEIR